MFISSIIKKSIRKVLKMPAKFGFAELPIAVMSAALVGTVIITSAAGYNLYDGAAVKVSQLRMARALADDETERIRSAGYDDVVKIEKPNGKLSNGYVKEIALSKEYREDIGNSVLKHKPVTINIYDSESSYFPLVSVKTEKISRWYKSGTFDKSDNGIYDETGEQHKGTIKKTGNGTGYVFLKKGAKVNGDVEIYDETNGDIYISNAIGTPGKKTLIRHVGPTTGSGYIRLAESCTINGAVTLENSSNGGLIIETNIPDGTHIAKLGTGTGYLKLAKGSSLGKNVKVTNESSGPIVVNKCLNNNSHLIRTGTSDGLLIMNGYINGTVEVHMNIAGNIEMKDAFLDKTVINYKSSTNKGLNISGSCVKGSITIVNDSLGQLIMQGTMTDNCKLKVSGVGNGAVKMYGIVEGSANIINDTDGYILIREPVKILDGKTFKKIGSGNGYMDLVRGTFLGDFTLDSDWSGYFTSTGGRDSMAGIIREPIFCDGAYICARGRGLSRLALVYGLQVLGRATFDVSNSPTRGFWLGQYDQFNGVYDLILPDGYEAKR